MDRVELKLAVKEQVKGHRWNLLKPVIIAGAIAYLLSTIISNVLPIFMFGTTMITNSGSELLASFFIMIIIASMLSYAITAPLQMGVNMYYSEYNKENFADINIIFKPFKYTIKIFVIMVFIGFLCSIGVLIVFALSFSIGVVEFAYSGGFLFFLIFLGTIPAIILSLAFSIIPYVYMKHPELGVMDMVSTSWRMMKGHKFEYFVLDLSFIGWFILSIFTFGILYIWLIPYYRMTIVRYFDQIDAEYFGTAQEDESDIDVNEDEHTRNRVGDNLKETEIEIDLSDNDKTE